MLTIAHLDDQKTKMVKAVKKALESYSDNPYVGKMQS